LIFFFQTIFILYLLFCNAIFVDSVHLYATATQFFFSHRFVFVFKTMSRFHISVFCGALLLGGAMFIKKNDYHREPLATCPECAKNRARVDAEHKIRLAIK